MRIESAVGLTLTGLIAPLVAAVAVLGGGVALLVGGKTLWQRWRVSRRQLGLGDPVTVRERLP